MLRQPSSAAPRSCKLVFPTCIWRTDPLRARTRGPCSSPAATDAEATIVPLRVRVGAAPTLRNAGSCRPALALALGMAGNLNVGGGAGGSGPTIVPLRVRLAPGGTYADKGFAGTIVPLRVRFAVALVPILGAR